MMAKAQHERPKKPLEIADRFETAIAPIEIEGQVVWEVGPANKIEPISGAIITLHQGEATQQVTDKNGSFVFKRVINAPPFKISVQADYFESRDYEIKSGQLNPVTLTPRTAELSGRVLTQVGDSIRPRELSHVDLKLDPLNIATATDGEGRFKFRLIGPQLDYLDTACKVYIEGYSLSRMLLMTSEMAIVVTPNNSIQVQEPQQCPKCNKIYADHKILKFCYKCGTDLRK
jgi:ribosomal protein S27AE